MSVVPEVKSRVTDEALVRRRRGQIVTAAVELFARQGFYNTTISDVARKAGVSTGLIYQYVSDKDDVLLLALMSVLELYRQEIPRALEGLSDPLERCFAAIRAYCRVVDQHRTATILAYRSTKSLPPDRREVIKHSEIETNGLIAACLRACIAPGLFRPVNADVAAYQIVTFAHTWALKHWRLKDLCTLNEYVRSGLDSFAHALLTPAGWRQVRKLRTRGEDVLRGVDEVAPPAPEPARAVQPRALGKRIPKAFGAQRLRSAATAGGPSSGGGSPPPSA